MLEGKQKDWENKACKSGYMEVPQSPRGLGRPCVAGSVFSSCSEGQAAHCRACREGRGQQSLDCKLSYADGCYFIC